MGPTHVSSLYLESKTPSFLARLDDLGFRLAYKLDFNADNLGPGLGFFEIH